MFPKIEIKLSTEPAIVVKDELANVNFYKDYNDYKIAINAFGGFTENADVDRQEYYSDPN